MSTRKKFVVSNTNWQNITKLVGCGVLTLGIVILPHEAIAVGVKDVPNPKQHQGTWVTDMANVLSPETEDKLNRSLSKLATTNGSELAVVTVPETTASATPKEFATELFNYWGIGKKGEDNGVLLLISKGERRVEVETGYGVEDVLPDAKVGNIIREKITPQFKQGNFDKGTLVGTEALIAVLEQKFNNSSNPRQLEQRNRPNWQVLYWLLGLGGMVGGVAIYLKNRLMQEDAQASVNLCPSCNRAMTKLDATILQSMLGQPQQVAQKIGSVRFEAWHCPNCQPQPSNLKEVRLSRKDSYQSNFKKCPVCLETTLERTSKVLQPATIESSGKKLVTDTCRCCSYHWQGEIVTNQLPQPPAPVSRNIEDNSSDSSRSSSSSDWSSSGYSQSSDWSNRNSGSSSSSSSDWSSGGSSDWGGGSSGGGGAGDSW